MVKTTSPAKEVEAGKRTWLKKRLVPLLFLLLAIGISVGLFVFAQRDPEKVKQFANYGYLGAFIVSIISNATIILPVPGILAFVPLVNTLNPALLALAGATGGIIGETTSYMAGYGGRGIIRDGPQRRMYDRTERWLKKWGVWAIFIFAAAPFLLFDIAGMVAGVLRLPLWKFLLAGWAGKTLKYIALAYAAAWGWEKILPFFS